MFGNSNASKLILAFVVVFSTAFGGGFLASTASAASTSTVDSDTELSHYYNSTASENITVNNNSVIINYTGTYVTDTIRFDTSPSVVDFNLSTVDSATLSAHHNGSEVASKTVKTTGVHSLNVSSSSYTNLSFHVTSNTNDTVLESISVDAGSIPVAEAGSDVTTETNTSVTLNASESFDIDGDNLSYEWTNDNGTVVSTNESFSVNKSGTGTYNYTVTVTDAGGNTDTVTVSVESSDSVVVPGNSTDYASYGSLILALLGFGLIITILVLKD